jgi:hypothetical protein
LITAAGYGDAEVAAVLIAVGAGGRTASVRRLLAHGAGPDLHDPVHDRTAREACAAYEEVAALLRSGFGRAFPGGGSAI